ncbi:MAG: class I SAM-dependent methyltransferase [Kofleriaceae bacterium]|nr:class I SAM-dependent methyltransferase [Myxococcales bacterium]MCB9562418.1 class I SAM-dependent methyltransferase [Kofleriaceae bacterium]
MTRARGRPRALRRFGAGDGVLYAGPVTSSPRLDNRSYYDDFAGWYERERGRGYHRMLDDLEVDLVRRYGEGKDVLEVGCGTGLILERVAGFARDATGVDLSGGMLAHAAARGLRVAQGSATALPVADASVDVAYSFKVLAHVEDIHAAMAEMARVVRPGGWVLAEFYNTRSLRRLVKAIKPPSAVSAQTDDEAVYTRYDSPDDVRGYLPPELEWVTARGIRIVTPVAAVHRVPGLGRLVRLAEQGLADLPIARELGGFLVAVARRR